MRNIIGYLVLFVIIVVLLIRGCSQSDEVYNAKEKARLAEVAKDSLKTEYNKKTKQYDNIKSAYVGSEENVKNFIQENDAELAKIAKNNKAGIVVHTRTQVDTIVRVVHDTIPGTKDDVRTADINTQYYNAHIVSTPEQMRLSFLMNDTVSYRLDKDNRLISSHSVPPNILKVTEQNSFFIENRQKKKNGKWIGGGLIGAAVTAIILKSL